MTYQEYCNQTEPQRRPTVYLTRRDIFSSSPARGGEHVTLEYPSKATGKKEYYTYFVPDGSEQFYTLDEHGNKLRPSVFRWVSLACGRLLPYLGDQLN